MPVIRPDQMAAMQQAKTRRFEDRVLAHLRKYYPESCRELGEPDTREAVRHGIGRAATYDVTVERDVCKYVDLMFFFGRDFDTDGDLPWAGEILNDPDEPNPSAKMTRLFEAAKRHEHQRKGILPE